MINVSGHNYSSMAMAGSSIQNKIDTSIQRLSSGQRINSAKDDVAGIQISTRLNAEIKGLEQASRNAADAQSLLDTAEGALQEVETHLLGMRELTVQAQNGTISDADKSALNQEVQQRITAIDAISSGTSLGGINLLDGSFKKKTIQVGASSANTIDATIKGASATNLDIKNFSLTAAKHTVKVGDPVSNIETIVPAADITLSDKEDTIYKFEIEFREGSENGYTHNTRFPYIKMVSYNTNTELFKTEYVELSRNQTWDNKHGSSTIDNSTMLSNGNIALVLKNQISNSHEGSLIIIDPEEKKILFPSEPAASSTEDIFTATLPDGNYSRLASNMEVIDLGNSEFVVVWEQTKNNTSNSGVFMQKFDYYGNKKGSVQDLSSTNGTRQNLPGSWSSIGNGILVGTVVDTPNYPYTKDIYIHGFDTNSNAILFENAITNSADDMNGKVVGTSKGFAMFWVEETNKAGYFQHFDKLGNTISAKIKLDDSIENGAFNKVVLSKTRNGEEFIDISYQTYHYVWQLKRLDLEGNTLVELDTERHSDIHSIANGDLLLFEGTGTTARTIKKLDFTENTTSAIDSALIKLNEDRASLGALSNRLDNIMAVNINTSINLSKANGVIKDANFTQETADLAKNNILQQTSIQMDVLSRKAGDSVRTLLNGDGFVYKQNFLY